jgi:P27 family predicted phage terminase small subunit
MAQNTPVPKHLTAKTRRWYADITTEFDLESHHLLLLQGAAECWDRAQQAREQLKKDGMTFTDRHGHIRPHPACQIERDSKALFSRLLRELALDVSEPQEIRPPELRGNATLRAHGE